MSESVPLEVEAKLSIVDLGKARALMRAPEIAGFRLRSLGIAKLRTIYLDTARFSLTKSGLAFRVRRDGRNWQATLKWSGQVRDGVHERQELNVDLDRPPKFPYAPTGSPLEPYLAAVLAGRGVSPILETNIVRHRFELLRGEALSEVVVAELDIDQVALVHPRSGDAVESYGELEIECRAGGTAADLTTVSEWLQRELGATAEVETKFGRGLARLYPKLKSQPAPVADANSSVDCVLRAFVARQLAALRAADVVARGGTDPEGVHQMRVALRRLRVGLKNFGEAAPALRLETMEPELEWLSGELGQVRELDVVSARVVACEPWMVDHLGMPLGSLKERLRARRAEGEDALRELLASRRYFRLLLQLERIGDGGARRASSSRFGDVASDLVARCAKRARKRGKDAVASESVDAIHALRLAIKRLRYVVDVSSPLAEKRAAKVGRDLARLQQMLGAYHDAIMAIDVVRADPALSPSEGDARAMLSAGAFLGFEASVAARCVRELKKAWRRFNGGKARRHLQSLLRDLDDCRCSEAAGRPTRA